MVPAALFRSGRRYKREPKATQRAQSEALGRELYC
jgi:hypothetical protein